MDTEGKTIHLSYKYSQPSQNDHNFSYIIHFIFRIDKLFKGNKVLRHKS